MGSLSAAFAAVGLAATLASPAFATTVNLPAGTPLQVQVINPISSGDASVGQRFAFQAAAPVVIGNRVLIVRGARGMGHVLRVSKAQGKSAGELTLQFTSVRAVDGSIVALTEVARNKGNPEKGKASTATIAATIALGPLGLFAHNMVKGKDVTITSDQRFPAWVRSNTSITVP